MASLSPSLTRELSDTVLFLLSITDLKGGTMMHLNIISCMHCQGILLMTRKHGLKLHGTKQLNLLQATFVNLNILPSVCRLNICPTQYNHNLICWHVCRYRIHNPLTSLPLTKSHNNVELNQHFLRQCGQKLKISFTKI